MQERWRSWSVVRDLTSCRVQASFHAPSVALEWAATVSSATAASTGCTRNAVGSSAWQRPLLQMYTVPGNCTPLGRQNSEGSPSRTWQAGGGSFLLLPRRHALSSRWATTCENRLEDVKRSCYQLALPATSLSRHVAVCTALVCGAQCTMPVRLCHWQSQTSNVCSEMTGQWSDRSAMSSRKTLSPSDPISYIRDLAFWIWNSFWRRRLRWYRHVERSNGAGKTYRLMESGIWKKLTERDCREWKLSAIDPLDRHTWRSCVRSAMRATSQLPGRGPLMWMLPLYLHVNQKSDNDDDGESPIFVPLCVLCFQEQYFKFLLTFHVTRLPSEFLQSELFQNNNGIFFIST